ncbi:MAG: hypothetical protein IT477_08545 [Rhodanobacteraceae bacterium]|nr:hypothetical protein [Rhodanobacteraceae bacterium]
MTLQRISWLFAGLGLACVAVGAVGHWLLAWPPAAASGWAGAGAGYLAGGVVLRLLPRWWRQHCDDMYAQPAGRRYLRALWPIMVGYTLALFASIMLIRRGIDSVPLRALVAVAPAFALVLLMRAALRYLREIDELQRRIETEAIGIASLLVSVLYFAAGLLQKAKVVEVDAATAMIWVFPLLCATYGIAKMLLTRRFQ